VSSRPVRFRTRFRHLPPTWELFTKPVPPSLTLNTWQERGRRPLTFQADPIVPP
jgi:hypothetical protein